MPEPRRLLWISLATSMLLVPNLSDAQQNPPRPKPKPATTTSRPAATQARDSFLGVWKLNPEISKYESGGPPNMTRTYEDRGGGTIFMTTDVVTPRGSARAYLVYRRDGKPYPESAVGAESIRLVTVRAIDPRTEELFFIVDGKPSDKPSTITISPDGKTMTQVVTVRNAKGQPSTNTVVYDKQP